MVDFSIGFSPCPNDCFIFDALIHNKIPLNGYRFTPVMEDVESLNQRALAWEKQPNRALPICKLSYHTLMHTHGAYRLLDSGSALGRGCGPLIVCKAGVGTRLQDRKHLSIAIPGEHTTANLLLKLFFPGWAKTKIMLFSDIEDAVASGMVDAGLIIHENRFTYAQKGLMALADLGTVWENNTKLPIPLGCIAIRSDLAEEHGAAVNRLIRSSVAYAFNHPEEAMPFVREHAQNMDPKVMKSHIDLYVNNYSLSLGEEGSESVQNMFLAMGHTFYPPIC
jgi:1,4-dihydroxy-6-naphthoate synthase